MRIHIHLEPSRELELPVHYGNLVQGLVYGLLERACCQPHLSGSTRPLTKRAA